MVTCTLCKQAFPDRKTLDRHACPMGGGGAVAGRVGFRYLLFSLGVLAAVSVFTWFFVTGRWAAEILSLFVGPEVDPTHVRIANGAAALVLGVTWWRHLLVQSPWAKLALTGLALAVWALSMPSGRGVW